jgi:anion-transporting  ArsA/GET3 family ATPase
MLLNEFIREHRGVEELQLAMAQQRKDFEATIVRQQKETEALVARLNEQEAWIQKVSAKIEVGNSESQMLVENQ